MSAPVIDDFAVDNLANQTYSISDKEDVSACYWLFDTGCGSHLSNTMDVYINPPDEQTTTMYTASGEPMKTSASGTTKCGFPHVRYAPDCQCCIFSPRYGPLDAKASFMISWPIITSLNLPLTRLNFYNSKILIIPRSSLLMKSLETLLTSGPLTLFSMKQTRRH